MLVCSEGGNPRKLVKAEERGTIFTVVVSIWSLVLGGTEIPLKSSSALTLLIAVLGGRQSLSMGYLAFLKTKHFTASFFNAFSRKLVFSTNVNCTCASYKSGSLPVGKVTNSAIW